eukprot:268400-Pyramimonas_sp.AAC.1
MIGLSGARQSSSRCRIPRRHEGPRPGRERLAGGLEGRQGREQTVAAVTLQGRGDERTLSTCRVEAPQPALGGGEKSQVLTPLPGKGGGGAPRRSA